MLSPRTFRIDFGVNLLAANILHTPPEQNLFPLQNALVNITREGHPEPDWYSTFRPGDTLVFRLVDITHLVKTQDPPTATADLAVAITLPDTGEHSDPFTQMPASWAIDPTMVRRKSPPFNPAMRSLPTWEIQPLDKNGQPISLIFAQVKGLATFELSVALSIDLGDGDIRNYVFDPELVVSETGGGMGIVQPPSGFKSITKR